MKEQLKVLFLLEDLCFGGTQMQNLELAARLDRKFFSPVILTLTGPTDLDKRAQDAGIPLYHIGSGRSVPPIFFTRIGRYLKKLRPDILVPCTALPNIWGRLWGKWKGVPAIIGTCRGGGAPSRQHEKLLWRLADGIICNSPQLMKVMRDIGANNLVYIPNGVDTERFKAVPKAFSVKEPLIVCVARLAGDKDHRTLISAFAKLLEHVPGARLRLVGEGPEEAQLRSFARKAVPESAQEQLEFAGPSSSPEQHYADADICALSSIREGQPNSILEAMSCARPVCGTAVGAIPDLLDGNGLISQPGDAEGMANNFLALLRAPAMAGHMAAAGRAKAEQEYSYAAMVSRHQDFFFKIVHRNGA